MDQSCSIALLILARSFNFALMTSFAKASCDRGQERQVDLILIIQIDLPYLGLQLQVFNPAAFVLVLWVSTGDGQHWPKQFIAVGVQIGTNTALVQTDSRLFCQIVSQQWGPLSLSHS
jgi:hypothetical protein